MSQSLDKLLKLLSLESVDNNIFCGQSQDYGLGQVYGGQVLGQALSAACQTVDDDRFVHSLHGYFLRSGDVSFPITYIVENLRDGKSFSSRRVIAIQKEKQIFHLSASFQLKEQGFEHQDRMPDCESFENLMSSIDLQEKMQDSFCSLISEKLKKDYPIDIRYETPINPYLLEACPPNCRYWFKTNGLVSGGEKMQSYLLAFASDLAFLSTALLPHSVRFLQSSIQMASIDHSMWFHRPFKMDEWLLYSTESPSASGARGLVQGKIFNLSGELVASTAQEGLIRLR